MPEIVTAIFWGVALGIAAYRVWRAYGQDDISLNLRAAMPAWLVHPVECAWCAGTWTAALVTAIAWWTADIPYPVVTAGIASVTVGMLGDDLQ